jgi:hypothetical protein
VTAGSREHHGRWLMCGQPWPVERVTEIESHCQLRNREVRLEARQLTRGKGKDIAKVTSASLGSCVDLMQANRRFYLCVAC